jgi:hypothetical protein
MDAMESWFTRMDVLDQINNRFSLLPIAWGDTLLHSTISNLSLHWL